MKLEKGQYLLAEDESTTEQNRKKLAKIRVLIMKILAKHQRLKDGNASACTLHSSDNTSGVRGERSGERNLRTKDSNTILEPLGDHANSISSAFDCYSTHSKASPSESKSGFKVHPNHMLSEGKHAPGVKQYYFTSRNFFQKRNDSSSSNNTHENFKKNSHKLGLFKIAEDEGHKEYDESEDESKDPMHFHFKKPDLETRIKKNEEYSGREKASANLHKLTAKADPLLRSKINQYNAPRGRDMLFSYNTQYGSGFGNFKNTKFGQYSQGYSRIEDKKKIPKKKQTASSLQRIEQSHQFGHGYNKISSNISKNEFSTSVYRKDDMSINLGLPYPTQNQEPESPDICLGK